VKPASYIEVSPDVFQRSDRLTRVELDLTDDEMRLALATGGASLLPEVCIAIMVALVMSQGEPLT